MRQIQYSSGDMVADRRAGYAAALAAERAYAEAAEVMVQALEITPHWAAGWDLLGGYREAAGDMAGALAAWAELQRLDAAGVFGAKLKMAAHGGGPGALGTERAYVEGLFDDYAARFEQSLARLRYSVPELIGRAISEVTGGGVRFRRTLDLGCGTGLMGEQVRGLVDRLEGVDLSANMLAVARRKGIYDRLEKAELIEFLAGEAASADLIVAADVYNYVGALEPVLAALAKALAPGGIAAFSLETHAGDEPVRLGRSLRYQHGVAATLELCRNAGFAVLSATAASVRMERGEPVRGLIVVLAADTSAAKLGEAVPHYAGDEV